MDGYIDPSELLGDVLIPWLELWDGSASIYGATEKLIKSCLVIPDSRIQLPNLVTHLWTNVKWCNVLPILFCYGREGSGKSTAIRICSALHGVPIFNGQVTTFAAIRNYLNNEKYLDDSCNLEADGPCLLYDNCMIDTFTGDADKLQLMLSGYNKATDTCSIAKAGEGQNMTFRTAATRIISSVEPIHSEYALREMRRRMTFCFHETLDFLDDDDLAGYGGIDLDNVDFKGFDGIYHNFWGDRGNCMLYAASLKGLRRPKSIPSRQWEFAKYLIAVGLTIGAFEDRASAYAYYSEYFQWVESRIKALKEPIEVFVMEFLERLTNKDYFENATLKAYFDGKVKSGHVLEKPRPKQIEGMLKKHRYFQVGQRWELR